MSETERDGDFAERVAFLHRNSDWPNQAALRRGAEAAMPEDLADPEVLDWFQTRPPLTTDGALRFAEALSRAGAGANAQTTALLRRIWIGRNLTDRQVRSFRKRFAGHLRREDEIARLDRLLRARKFAPAKRQARRLGGGYPALVAARQRLATGRGGVDAAIRRVPAALRNDPGLIFERARWRKRKGLDSGAIALLDGLTPSPPQAERWWPLRRWAARRSLLLGDASAAYRIAAGHGLDSGLEFAEGEWLAGWIALRFLDSPEIGYGHFTRLYGKVGKPISLARAAFWAGEAAQAIDQARITAVEQSPGDSSHDATRQWYVTAATHGTTFYGQLARQRLGRAPSIVLPGPATPEAESRAAFDAQELVRVVRILGELGETKLQKKFLRRLGTAATTDAEHALVAELAMQQG
ncbi:MAG: lytic transglycosylase domain-containing protein, partial [Kiloniellales bacterium]